MKKLKFIALLLAVITVFSCAVMSAVSAAPSSCSVSVDVIGNGKASLLAVIDGQAVPVKDGTVAYGTQVRIIVIPDENNIFSSAKLVTSGGSSDITGAKSIVIRDDSQIIVEFKALETKPDEPVKEDCSCLCHKNGIMKVLYKIVLFFWRLFDVNSECACKAVHY